MKTIKRVFALILTLMLLFCSTMVFASAYDDEWTEYYNSIDNTFPTLTPGADETQLILTWHAPVADAASVVTVVDSNNDSKTFTAVCVPAETDAQIVNRAVITGLKENMSYTISYILNGEIVTISYKTHSFSNFSVLVTTDAQVGTNTEAEPNRLLSDAYEWNKTLTAAFAKNPDLSFIIHTGDQTQNGTEHSGPYAEEWKGFYAPSILRSVPIVTIVGNHDTRVDSEGAMKYYWSAPNQYAAEYPSVMGTSNWYTYGDVLFVNFESTMSHASDVYGVAKEAVEANPDAKWLIGCMHHDLYGGTDSAVSAESTILFKNIFEPVFNEFNFDVVFTGHSHSYCRSHQMFDGKIVLNCTDINSVTDPAGTVYISTCCAGNKYDDGENTPQPDWVAYRYIPKENLYTLVDFSEDSLEIKTYKVADDTVVDDYTIVKTLPRDTANGENLQKNIWYSIVKALSSIYRFFGSLFDYFKNISIM